MALKEATGTFEIESNEEPAYDSADGVDLTLVSISKTFDGPLKGESSMRMLKAVTSVPGSAGYVGVERFSGSLEGKEGSFVCQHNGIMTRGKPELTVAIVPDSGTGELEGITGTLSINVVDGQHEYTIAYGFDED
ncbi:DUF3224 domain-containing protein [Glycomyces halotolerans]